MLISEKYFDAFLNFKRKNNFQMGQKELDNQHH